MTYFLTYILIIKNYYRYTTGTLLSFTILVSFVIGHVPELEAIRMEAAEDVPSSHLPPAFFSVWYMCLALDRRTNMFGLNFSHPESGFLFLEF